jgi:hypothetical protein
MMSRMEDRANNQPKFSLKERTAHNLLLLAGINYVCTIMRGWRISSSPCF